MLFFASLRADFADPVFQDVGDAAGTVVWTAGSGDDPVCLCSVSGSGGGAVSHLGQGKNAMCPARLSGQDGTAGGLCLCQLLWFAALGGCLGAMAAADNDIKEMLETLSEPLWLVCLDLDNFKSINDQYGHDIGDQYLRRFGTMLEEMTEQNGQAYRTGGDEFAVLYSGGPAEKIEALRECIVLIS